MMSKTDMMPKATFLETTTCSVCSAIVMRSLTATPRTDTSQIHCAKRAVVTIEPGDTLAGFTIGDVIEADLARGGHQNDDGITKGSKIVTKRGKVSGVDNFYTGRTSLSVRFDDGDYQVMTGENENGATVGYPTRAFRRVPAPVTLASLVARASAEGWDVGRYMAELKAAGLSRKLYIGSQGQWIGENEDGKLYAFPGEEDGWMRRRPWTGATPQNEVNPRNALGTGWVGGPAPRLEVLS